MRQPCNKDSPRPKCRSCWNEEALPYRVPSWAEHSSTPRLARSTSLSPWSKHRDSRKILGYLGPLELAGHSSSIWFSPGKIKDEELREVISARRWGGGAWVKKYLHIKTTTKTVLCTWSLRLSNTIHRSLRKCVLSVLTKHTTEEVTMWDYRYVDWLDCGHFFTVYVYIKLSHCTP